MTSASAHCCPADSGALVGTEIIISSAETIAIETAPIAKTLNCSLEIREIMHENDRSVTGFLQPEQFETVADQFFAHSYTSKKGWETAKSAQIRTDGEVREPLSAMYRLDFYAMV